MRAARDWGLPPSMLADESERPRRPRWTWRDRLLAQALTAYESSLCEGCGQNRHRSMNPHGEYQVHPHTCYGCAALEQVRKDQRDQMGVKNYLVDASVGDLPDYPFSLEPIDAELYDELMRDGAAGEAVPMEEPGL